MANWISSKLKAAETILQQIDLQAAESLGKNEKSHSHDQVFELPIKPGGSVSLKDQLKKKTPESNDLDGRLQRNSFEHTIHNSNNGNNKVFCNRDRGKERMGSPKISAQQKPNLTDSDWTELLSTPNPPTSTSGTRVTNGVSMIRVLKKDGQSQGISRSNRLRSNQKRSQKSGNNMANSPGRSNKQLSGKLSDGEDSNSSGRASGVEMQTDFKNFDGGILEHNDNTLKFLVKPKPKGNEEDMINTESKPFHAEDLAASVNKSPPLEKVSEIRKDDARDSLRSAVWSKQEMDEISKSSVSDDLKGKNSSPISDDVSDSDSDSDSSADSQREREKEERRRRREKILAEKVAAKAAEAIKERENMVARLEGEKLSLEKILEERAKQQAKEASELQTNMMETMEAVELEKQKHNNTRMEVLARLARLETANADLARSLAAAQKKLEAEIDRVAEHREQIELKQSAHEELKRRIFGVHQTGKYLDQLTASRGVEFEHQMLEAECSLITDKIGWLQDKAKKLEADVEMTREEMEELTEVEIELKQRLNKLTDHLIQKQAQVESLSSEKATLLFRTKAVSRLLDENKTMSITDDDASSRDLESGQLDLSESKPRPVVEEKLRFGKKHLGSMVQQLNTIFLYGAVFLRRNPKAKVWSLVYIVCLHLWVLYILLSGSDVSSEGKAGAVISLENINNTASV